jgi:hypothetical protein
VVGEAYKKAIASLQLLKCELSQNHLPVAPSMNNQLSDLLTKAKNHPSEVEKKMHAYEQ